MTESDDSSSRPDLTQGIALDETADGAMIEGHVGDAAVLLVRRADELFAVGAQCRTTARRWPTACWKATRSTARGITRRSACAPARCCARRRSTGCRAGASNAATAVPSCSMSGRRAPGLKAAGLPASVVIVGGGAAAIAAAVTLRQEGYPHPVTLLTADADPPYDRPNLSKDYLAGTADADWLPLRAPSFYADHHIDVRCGTRVVRIDSAQQAVELADGSRVGYGAAARNGRRAEPADRARRGSAARVRAALARRLRRADRQAENGAALRRGRRELHRKPKRPPRCARAETDVQVVAPDAHPMARVLGEALGSTIRHCTSRTASCSISARRPRGSRRTA